MKEDTAIMDEYYNKAIQTLDSDKDILLKEITKMEVEVETATARLKRYKSVKAENAWAERYEDNLLQDSKVKNLNKIDTCNKITLRIDLIRQILASNKKKFVQKRLKSEKGILQEGLDNLKQVQKGKINGDKRKIARTKRSLASSMKNRKGARDRLKVKKDTLSGKIKTAYHSFRLYNHENAVTHLKNRLKNEMANLKKDETLFERLNRTTDVRSSTFYEELKTGANGYRLENNSRYSILFLSHSFSVFDNSIEMLDKWYSDLLKEFEEDKLVTRDQMYNL